jgi:hypothetical protein
VKRAPDLEATLRQLPLHEIAAIIGRQDRRVLELKREMQELRKTTEKERRNAAYYRGILERIGDLFGEAARTLKDGTIAQGVLILKVEPLVRALFSDRLDPPGGAP